MNKTKIEWTDYTINPVKGLCPMACSYCYARAMYKRFRWNPEIRYDDWSDNILRYKLLDGKGEKVDFWQMALPTNINLDEYEKKKDEMLMELLERAKTTFVNIETGNTDKSKKTGKRALLYPRVAVVQEELKCSASKACTILGVNTGDYGIWRKEQRASAVMSSV